MLACAVALDPLCELWVHELKGSGDLDPLERVSHRFSSGIDDEAIGYAAESLRLLRQEIGRRAERLKALPRELCPDKRVTREIAAKRSLKLWPVMCAIDELQNLFTHEQIREGRRAGRRIHYQDRASVRGLPGPGDAKAGRQVPADRHLRQRVAAACASR